MVFYGAGGLCEEWEVFFERHGGLMGIVKVFWNGGTFGHGRRRVMAMSLRKRGCFGEGE